MRVALVHYWLLTMRGGEKVLGALGELFPSAEIFSHVIDRKAMAAEFSGHELHESFISRLPMARMLYQNYLPLMPLALEQLDFRNFDLVISSESGPAKGIIVPPYTPHICYCHSPMRYAWDMYHDYRDSAGTMKRMLMAPLMHRLRLWDYASAARVDYFVANSNFVAQRIAKYYRREAEVIHPPVSVEDFDISSETDDFYLILGQLVAYKRVDLAVRAFTKMGKRLIVVGEGAEFVKLKSMAGPTVEFLGRQPFANIKKLYSRCRALVFPGLEDFGIVPLEAMASGRPVIAYGKGGALETVLDGSTGIFFHNQSVEALVRAVHEFEENEACFSPREIAAHAQLFSKNVFKKKMSDYILSKTGLAPSNLADLLPSGRTNVK